MPKYIKRRLSGRWLVRVPEAIIKGRYVGTYCTLEQAIEARDQALANAGFKVYKDALIEIDAPVVEGLTNVVEQYEPEALWAQAEKAQAYVEQREKLRKNQSITVPGRGAFGIAYFSDLHIGSRDVDYRSLKRDAEIVRDAPRLYASFHGDGTDNWIIGKLASLERGQALPFDAEVQLFINWLEMLKGKLLWVVSGNHDNWTHKLSGIDGVQQALKGCSVLYDRHEICFTLKYQDREVKYKVRHKWRYGSIFNATHNIEVGWERGGSEFDIGVGGHTHIGTVCRPFYRHGKKRYAILTGTYKIDGEYGRELGLPRPCDRGCGAHVFYDDKISFFEDLETAARFIEFCNH